MPSIQLKEINLHYQSVGQGEPVRLIHGLGSSTRDWEEQASCFANYYRVITLEQTFIERWAENDKQA